jgi:hypothetical protein
MAKVIWLLDMVSAISQLTATAYLGIVFWDILAPASLTALAAIAMIFFLVQLRLLARRASWAYVRATRVHPKEIRA